jgi:hypothetical protein
MSASASRRRQISHRLIGATTNPCAKVSDRTQMATIDATVSAYTPRMPATARTAASTGARRHVVHDAGRSIACSTSRFMRVTWMRRAVGTRIAFRAAIGVCAPRAEGPVLPVGSADGRLRAS